MDLYRHVIHIKRQPGRAQEQKSHEPSSSVAAASKLHAFSAVQPEISNSSQTPSLSESVKQLPAQSYPDLHSRATIIVGGGRVKVARGCVGASWI